MDNNEIVISGAGYVGLTGGIHLALAGFKVILYDPDEKVVAAINSGQPKAGEYLGYIATNLKTLNIVATTDYESIKHKPVHFLATPTERGSEPYMDIVKSCILKLHDSIPEGGLIIVESTLQPGTIDSLTLPRVYRDEIGLAVCPRLDWFADSTKNLTNLPRIVGGVTPKSTELAVELLSEVCDDIRPTRHGIAEFAKAGQNALYFVQVMAAHQLAKMYQDKEDMNEVLKLIGVHWRLPDLYLGPGTSGRCVAMGAKYIVGGAHGSSYEDSSLFKDALRYDTKWRELVADTITKEFGFLATPKILIMGIAYRPDFSDFGYSAGLDIAKYLQDYDWDVSIHDPIIPLDILKKASSIEVRELNNEFDAILLATAHSAYLNVSMDLFKKGAFVLDATGGWEHHRAAFKHLGVKYKRIGEKGWLNT